MAKYRVELRGGSHVLVSEGGVRSASLAEVWMAERIAELEARLTCEDCGNMLDEGPGEGCLHPASTNGGGDDG